MKDLLELVRSYLRGKNFLAMFKRINAPKCIIHKQLDNWSRRLGAVNRRMKTHPHEIPKMEEMLEWLDILRTNKELQESTYNHWLLTINFFVEEFHPDVALFSGDECVIIAEINKGTRKLMGEIFTVEEV